MQIIGVILFVVGFIILARIILFTIAEVVIGAPLLLSFFRSCASTLLIKLVFIVRFLNAIVVTHDEMMAP